MICRESGVRRMINRTIERLIILGVFLVILVLCIIASQEQDQGFHFGRNRELNFSGHQQAYIAEHESVTIAVDDELTHLLGTGEQGYLEDYLTQVFAPAQIRPVFITDEQPSSGVREDGTESADCRLSLITQEVRAENTGRVYTAPLFQIEGSLFVRKSADDDAHLQAVIMEGRLSERKLQRLRFNEQPVQFREAQTAEDTVDLAVQTDAEGILGDRSAIRQVLLKKGLKNTYIPREQAVYSINACLIFDENNVLHDVLNQCIQSADRHALSYVASETWLAGEGPVYLRRTAEKSYLPMLIVLVSVMLAFMVYYFSNRNMYRELNLRMDRIRASQNELQTTFNSVGHYLAELTLDGEVLDMNRAFMEDVGMGFRHRMIWNILELDEEGKHRVRQMVRSSAGGEQEERFETNVGNRTFVMDTFPIEDARGKIEKLLFMAIDVTQERMAKRQMLQDNKMIAIGQLAAGVAHEIRNPLGIIRNYCYVLKTMEDEEVRAKAIEAIENAVEVSGGIINNLLDFSRISPGREEEIDVEEHVRAMLALNDKTLRTQNTELIVTCTEPIRTYMAMEPFDMILMNLVNNAMDAMPDGGRLSVEISRDEDHFVMSVSDTGTGIPQDVQEEIFNPFYTTKGNKGIGLGLYIVYNEIEKMNGEIDVISREGVGTTFFVRLPIREHISKEEQ